MIYKRGKAYSYNFRWSIRHEDGTVENFCIRQSAKTHKRKEAEDAENEHKRALRLGEIHPNDPWPKPAASAPPVFRAFAKEFLQFAKTHTKPGTQTFYGVCLDRFSTFAAIADAPLDAITGDVVSRYARHRQEVPKNSVITVNGDLRTLRRVLHLAVEWGWLDRAPAIYELPQAQGRDRVLRSFAEEAKYLAKASENLRDAAILAVDTGMRPNSELFPLKWADVDLTERPESPHGVIHVRLRARRTAHSEAFPSRQGLLRFYSAARGRERQSHPRLCSLALAFRDISRLYSIRTRQPLKTPSWRASSSIAGGIRSEPAPHSPAWTALPWPA